MSTSTEGLAVPQWDLADRLGKALRVGDVSVQEMADYLEVHRNSVSAWINGRVTPSGQTIRLWALRTGIPYEWLRNGIEPSRPGPDPDDGGRVDGETPNHPIRGRAPVTWLDDRRPPASDRSDADAA